MAKDLKKAEHKVLRPLRHSNEHYPKGAKVVLTADEAAPLIKTGVVAKPEKEEKEPAQQ